jgi:hypothetical protein
VIKARRMEGSWLPFFPPITAAALFRHDGDAP